MKILEYRYRDAKGWDFDKVRFGNLNLLVGDSATGKTRLLNTIFNLGRFVAAKEFKSGQWEITIEQAGVTYIWGLQTTEKDNSLSKIARDFLWRKDGDELVPLVERDANSFSYMGKIIPKLPLTETSISLLKEEDTIRPLYEAFSAIKFRRFSRDALSRVSEFQVLPMKLVESFEENRGLKEVFETDMGLSASLFILSKYFKNIYKEIVDLYRKFFPFVQEARMTDLTEIRPNIASGGFIPVFTIREHGSDNWVPIGDLSSGMQKVLLILTDVSIIPEESVYMIDEYENSLGINAIDFFPDFILGLEKKVQFFITSHHPYLINEIPPNNWYIFHRNGMRVTIQHGEELTQRFGKSKQQAFIQLINDPFFTKGIE